MKWEAEEYLEKLLDLDLDGDLETDRPYRLHGEGE